MLESRLITIIRRSKSINQIRSSFSSNGGSKNAYSRSSLNSYSTLRNVTDPTARCCFINGFRSFNNYSKGLYKPSYKYDYKCLQGKQGDDKASCYCWTSCSESNSLPPLSDKDWFIEFEKYKQSPEFKRALGVMFAVPFSYFIRKGYINLRLGVRLTGLFALGGGQGLIGWWMVKSGLEEPPSEYSQPRVSPYRLAAHLTSAFAIYCGLFWTALTVVMPEPPTESIACVKGAAKVKRFALPIGILVGITAVSGAFVAGNDAGRAFNTFPKMGDSWIPEDVLSMTPLIRNLFENTATVQLDHRILATATLASICSLWWSTRRVDLHPAIRALIGSTLGMAALQVTLGISTLLSYVLVSLGTAHQAGALTLLTLMLLLNHTLRRPSSMLLKSLPAVAKTI